MSEIQIINRFFFLRKLTLQFFSESLPSLDVLLDFQMTKDL